MKIQLDDITFLGSKAEGLFVAESKVKKRCMITLGNLPVAAVMVRCAERKKELDDALKHLLKHDEWPDKLDDELRALLYTRIRFALCLLRPAFKRKSQAPWLASLLKIMGKEAFVEWAVLISWDEFGFEFFHEVFVWLDNIPPDR